MNRLFGAQRCRISSLVRPTSVNARLGWPLPTRKSESPEVRAGVGQGLSRTDRGMKDCIDLFLVSIIVALWWGVRVGYNSENLCILSVTVVSEMAMSRLDLIIEQLSIARLQTESLLDSITSEDWFRQPTEGVTHVA